jgi:hypothetical protein
MPGAGSSRARTDQNIDSTMKPNSVPASSRTASEGETEEKAARTKMPTAVQPIEPEDAYLTGVSRSLQRRLLGLNVGGARPQAKPVSRATQPGLPAAGSYSATQGVKPSGSARMVKNRNKE